MAANRRMFWKVRARPSRGIRKPSICSSRTGPFLPWKVSWPDGRPVEAGQAVEHRGLAGAVRADDGGDLALGGDEIEVVDRDQPAEPHGQVLDPQDRPAAHAGFLPLPAGCSRMVGITPAEQPARAPDHDRHHGGAERQHPVLGEATRHLGQDHQQVAASTTPIWLPMPPSTTMARMVALSMKVKLSGLMKPWRVAKNEPAKPPNIAPSAKAVSLVLVGLMPSALQAISSSRSASQARPIGRRRRRSDDEIGEQRQQQDQESRER